MPAAELAELRQLDGALLARRCRRLLADDEHAGQLDEDAYRWLAELAYAAELGAGDRVAAMLGSG